MLLNISPVTLDLLKCCNNIEDHILIYEGDFLLSKDGKEGTILFCQIPFEDSFPKKFKINKLGQFLMAINELSNKGKDEINISIEDPYIKIVNPKEKLEIKLTQGVKTSIDLEEPQITTQTISRNIDYDISFQLSDDMRQSLQKKASILGCEYIRLVYDQDGKLFIGTVPKTYVDSIDRHTNISYNSFNMEVLDFEAKDIHKGKSIFINVPFNTLPSGFSYTFGIVNRDDKNVVIFDHTTEDNRIIRFFAPLQKIV